MDQLSAMLQPDEDFDRESQQDKFSTIHEAAQPLYDEERVPNGSPTFIGDDGQTVIQPPPEEPVQVEIRKGERLIGTPPLTVSLHDTKEDLGE